VFPAGLRIPDEDVRELITLVDEPTRSFPEKSLALDNEVVALTVEDRERILWALDDVRTDALAELCGVLLQEHDGVHARGSCIAYPWRWIGATVLVYVTWALLVAVQAPD